MKAYGIHAQNRLKYHGQPRQMVNGIPVRKLSDREIQAFRTAVVQALTRKTTRS